MSADKIRLIVKDESSKQNRNRSDSKPNRENQSKEISVPVKTQQIPQNDPKKLEEVLGFIDDVASELERKHIDKINDEAIERAVTLLERGGMSAEQIIAETDKGVSQNPDSIKTKDIPKTQTVQKLIIEEVDEEESEKDKKDKISARREKRARAKKANKRLKALKGEQGERGRDGSSGGAAGTKGERGERGEKGEKGDTGSDGTSVIWRGAYSPTAGYTVLNAVSYQGSSYICKVATSGTPPTNATYWDVMASAGDDGSGTVDYSLVIAYSIALG